MRDNDTSAGKEDTFESIDTRFDVAMQIVLFLEEARNARMAIGQASKGYMAGKVDMVTVSLVTNTAVDLIEERYDALAPKIQKAVGSNTMTMLNDLSRMFGSSMQLDHRSSAQDHNDVDLDLFLVAQHELVRGIYTYSLSGMRTPASTKRPDHLVPTAWVTFLVFSWPSASIACSTSYLAAP